MNEIELSNSYFWTGGLMAVYFAVAWIMWMAEKNVKRRRK